jgi:hypothetical protein
MLKFALQIGGVVGSMGWIAVFMTAGAIAITTRASFADEAPSGSGSSIAYRRIFVPADNLAAWPRGDDKFLPVESHDFDHWIADANRPAGAARITEAEYEARLDGRKLVAGRGRWKIQLADQTPAFLSLAETSLVVTNAQWRNDKREAAQFGAWARGANQPLVRGVAVTHSGEMEFDWHTFRAQSQGDDFDFQLQIPIAVTNRLTLDLPETMIPALEGGEVLESRALTAGETKKGARAQTSEEPAILWHRWIWAVGPSVSHRLQIAASTADRTATPPAATVREETRYHVTNHGLDIEARLRLHAGDDELHELNLLFAAGPKIISVTANDQEIAWHLTGDAPGTKTRVTIALPKSVLSGETAIVLKAWDKAAIQQSWPMPTVQIENAFWSSGTIKLSVDDGFELEDVVPRGCTQTAVHQDESPEGNSTTLEFQSFLPDASMEARVGPRLPTAHVRTGTSLQVGGATANGRIVAQLQVDRGGLPTMSGELQPGWAVNGVETIPAEALGQWYVDTRRDARKLELVLNRAASFSNPVMIIVTGERRRAEPLDSLDRDTLEMLRWQGSRVDRNLLQLQTSGRYELKSTNDLSSVSIDELSDDDRQLFAAPTEGRMYDMATSPAGAMIGLAPTTGIYDAEVEFDATIRGQRLQQSYHVLCRPHGGGIDRVTVYFSEPLDVMPRWEVAETHEPVGAERMPESDPRLAGFSPGGELWTLRLQRLYARPFSLAMSVETPWTERRPVTLVSLPDAATQLGWATIRSVNRALPAIAVQAMSPAPLPAAPYGRSPQDDGSRICEIYHYDPVRSYQAGSAPRLWLGPAPQEMSEASVVAQRTELESFFAADGSGVHRVSYQLESSGTSGVGWKLPSGARLESVDLDGKSISPQAIAITGDAFLLPLPSSFERGVLSMELRTAGPPLAQRPTISAPLPVSEMPILAGNWSIWLPEEFAATGDGVDPNFNEFNWQDRLLGPLNWLSGHPIASPRRLANDVTPSKLASRQFTSSEPSTIDPAGWRAFCTTFAASPPEPINVVEMSRRKAVSGAALLLSLFAALLWRMPARPFILVAAAAAVLALCLPADVAPLATGVLWGLLFSPICRWAFWKPAQRHVAAAGSQIGRERRIELASLVILAAIFCVDNDAFAQAPNTDSPTSDNAAIHRVLLPVDVQGWPAGSKYFVDEQFLRKLLERSAARDAAGGTWLLRKMRCEGKLFPVSDERSGNAGNWLVTMDAQTLSRDTSVDLPFVQSQGAWPATALLDGIPVPITWNRGGVGCSIIASEPGRHQLAIRFDPSERDANGSRKLEIELPAMAGAEFRLNYPASIAAVNVVGGQFETHVGPAGVELAGELDGTSHLSATWTEHNPVANTATSLRVDELSWLRIQRDRVELEVRYAVIGERPPDTLVIAADRQWELVSDTTADKTGSEAPEIDLHANGLQSIRVPVSVGDEERCVASLRFRLRSATPPGQLRLPSIELTSQSEASRRLAVSADAEWDCEALGGAVVAGGPSAAEFAAAWGPHEGIPPQVILNLADCRRGWYLVVRPRAVESKSDERLTVVAGRDQLKLQYEADIQPQGAHRFRWSLSVPDTLTIDNVAVSADGRPVSLDFVRAASDRVNVFFAAVVDNTFHVTIDGRMTVTDGECPLPWVTAIDRPAARQLVQLYRNDDVTVETRRLEMAGSQEQRPAGAPDKGGQQFVGAYAVVRTTAKDARLLIEPVTIDTKKSSAKIESPMAAPRSRPEELSASIRLAETNVFVAPAGGWYSVTRFVVAPHGLTQCVLQLSGSQRLVEIRLDGHAALTQKMDSQRWRVQLGPPALPQTLEVVARGVDRIDPTSRIAELDRPILWEADRPISVEVSLWSVSESASTSSPRAAGAALVSPLECAVVRLDRLTSIAESATHTAMAASTEDARNWIVPRVSELLSAQHVVQELQSQLTRVAPLSPRVQADDDPSTLAIARSAAWLAQAKELAGGAKIEEVETKDSKPDPTGEMFGEPPPSFTTASFVSQGGADQLTIEFVPVGLTEGETRAGLLAGIIGLTGLSIWIVSRPRMARHTENSC